MTDYAHEENETDRMADRLNASRAQTEAAQDIDPIPEQIEGWTIRADFSPPPDHDWDIPIEEAVETCKGIADHNPQ